MTGNSEQPIGDDLRGLHQYLKDLLQTPFGILQETMHLAASVASDSNILPNISWFGDTEYQALAIHGKRIELKQLKKLAFELFKRCKRSLDRDLKMGLPGIKNHQWNKFTAADDMAEIKPGYWFGHEIEEHQMDLLNEFMSNGASKDYFSAGASSHILWRRKNIMQWLKRCKEFLQMMMVLTHILGGQPGRSTEISTIRWCNSAEEQRGVYWLNDTVMLLSIYSKNRSRMSKNRIVPR